MQINPVSQPAMQPLSVPAESAQQAPEETMRSSKAVESSPSPAPPVMGTKNLPVNPADSSVSGMDKHALLQSGSVSGGLPVKLATNIYALNHSFDIQKLMIDLLI